MKLSVRQTGLLSTYNAIELNHNDQQLVWEISPTDKAYVNTTFDLFEQINKYWEYISPEKVNEIFSVYKEINEIFNQSHHRDVLTKTLYVYVGKLLDLHDFDDVKHWVIFRSGINFPKQGVLADNYIASPDKPSTRGQTYIRDDYVSLITMTVILRTMIPIWGEFIRVTKSEVKNVYKELYAFKLIYKSKLMESEAMLKLKTYVEYSTQVGKTKHAPILEGMSSVDFPVWMLGLVVTRRLCVCDIRGTDTEAVVIIHIYNFIDSRVRGIDNNFSGAGGIISAKKFDKPTQDNDPGVLEGYKFRQEIQPGDIIALRHSVEDPMVVAIKIQPNIDPQLVTSALKTSKVLFQNKIQDVQILLLQWCIKPILPNKAIDYIPKKQIVKLLAVCQAVLIHRGHIELAGLITAKPSVEEDASVISASSSDARSRMPKEMIDELNYLFPHMRKPNGKSKTIKMTNQAFESIDLVVRALNRVSWVLTLSDTHVQKLTGYPNQRRYTIPSNIRTLLGAVVIQNAKKAY